jgi:predicted nucleic acid-binding protein
LTRTMPPAVATSLGDFQAANWEAFSGLESSFDRELRAYSRKLPPRFYRSVRDGLLTALGPTVELITQGQIEPRFRFTVVIDTNIVVQDSINVARGRPSTTERILASPFVTVLAPLEIREECERILQERARKNKFPIEIALQQTASLLKRVRLVDPKDDPHVRRARELIGEHSPEDVKFLAVAMESDASAVVSRDSAAFDNQRVVRRWPLHELVDSIVAFESGALSVAVVSKSAAALVRALQRVLVAVLRAIFEVVKIALDTLAALVKGVLDAISKMPAWALLLAIGVTVGVGAYAATHPEFRDKAARGFAALTSGIRTLGEALVQIGRLVIGAFHDMLIWLWELFLPVTASLVVMAGVLVRRVQILVSEADRLRTSVPI